MSSFNKRSRELKMKYHEDKDKVTANCDHRQTALTIDIEMMRNERSYWIAMLKKSDNDEEGLKNCKEKIDELSVRIGDKEMQKCDLDRERKATINILKREYYEAVDALENEFSQKGVEA